MKEKTRAPALKKGLRIIEILARSPEPMTMTQISRSMGFKVPEIQRMLEYLVEAAYLLKNEAGAYYLSSKLYRIIIQNPPQRYLLSRALASMERFTQVTGESIHISVLIDYQINFIGQVEGTGITRLTVRLGGYPAHKTTSGKLLISYLDFCDLDRFDLTVEERKKLKSDLVKINKNGYAFNKSAYTEGVYDLAVPIHIPNVGPIGALATTFLPDIGEEKRNEKIEFYVDKLRECAGQITVKYEKQM